MIKLSIDDKIYSLPQTLDELTIGNYEKWHDVDISSAAGFAKVLQEMCEITEEEVMEMPCNVFNSLKNLLIEVNKSVANVEPKNEINIAGTKYIINTTDDLTIGEYADIESVYSTEDNKTKFTDVLSIILRPVGNKYNYKENQQRKELFQKQSLMNMLPLLFFFWQKSENQKNNIAISSLAEAIEKEAAKIIKNLELNGDGIPRLSFFRRMIFSRQMKSLKKQFQKYSTSYPSCKTERTQRRKSGKEKKESTGDNVQ